MTTAITTGDLYCWQTPVPGTNPPVYDHHRVVGKGAEIEVSDEEFARGERLGFLARPEVYEEVQEALDAGDAPVPPGEEGDAVLAGWKAAELVAYVGQFPAEADRVAALQLAKGRTADGKLRGLRTVFEAAGYDPDTGEKSTPTAAASGVVPGTATGR